MLRVHSALGGQVAADERRACDAAGSAADAARAPGAAAMVTELFAFAPRGARRAALRARAGGADA
jgi:hypothetical protein